MRRAQRERISVEEGLRLENTVAVGGSLKGAAGKCQEDTFSFMHPCVERANCCTVSVVHHEQGVNVRGKTKHANAVRLFKGEADSR